MLAASTLHDSTAALISDQVLQPAACALQLPASAGVVPQLMMRQTWALDVFMRADTSKCPFTGSDLAYALLHPPHLFPPGPIMLGR